MDDILHHFGSCAFNSAWRGWFENRKELKQPCSERVRRKWGKWLVDNKFTEDEAIECLKEATLRDWQGLYDHRNKQHGKTPGKGTSADRIDALKKW